MPPRNGYVLPSVSFTSLLLLYFFIVHALVNNEGVSLSHSALSKFVKFCDCEFWRSTFTSLNNNPINSNLEMIS